MIDAHSITPSSAALHRHIPDDYVVFRTTPGIHTVYAATWFSLSVALAGLTYLRFRRRPPPATLQRGMEAVEATKKSS